MNDGDPLEYTSQTPPVEPLPSTPTPGRRLDPNDEKDAYARFLAAFKKVEPDGVPTFLPTNCKFLNPRFVDAAFIRPAL